MWRKSSYSADTANCVEVSTPDFRKSSRCDTSACVEVGFHAASRSSGNGACVEVGRCDCGVLVRDSKDPGGPVLSFSSASWRAFLVGISAGEYDL